MKFRPIYVVVAVVAVVGFVGGILFYQNLSHTTDLTASLGFGSWHLKQEVPVMYLMLGSFAAGAVFPAVALGMWGSRKAAEVRRLEQELVLKDGQASWD